MNFAAYPGARSTLILGGAEIDLWSLRLDHEYDLSQENTLSPDEWERARRYLIPQVRQRFISSRAMLRGILADYLHIEPGAVSFQYARYGKPSLGEHHPLRFNLSHSENLLLLAVSWQREIGVDVEWLNPATSTDTIAAQFFAPAEYARFKTLSPALKPQAFFDCWTRKEAYIKACSGGMSIPLSDFEVSFLPGEPPRLIRPPNSDSRHWEIGALAPALGYTGAVVVESL